MIFSPHHKTHSRRFARQLTVWLLAPLILAGMVSAAVPGANVSPIILKAERLSFTPKHFYIAGVTDARADRGGVASIIPAAAPGTTPVTKPQVVDMQGGMMPALQQYISKAIPQQDKNLHPVVIRVNELKVTETAAANGRVKGQAVVSFTFELQTDAEALPLTDYRGGIRYDRPASQMDAIEPALRQSLAGALTYFNKWMEREANTNQRLAKEIKVIFSDYSSASAADTVFYNPKRPLTWSDFTGKPTKPSKYAAAVFPSFSYEGRTEVADGILHLHLNMKVYMLQSSSWVKEGSKNTYGLTHEQRHFDIARLVAERFKQKIRPEILSVADYNSIIQYHFIESFREMNQLQEQYDAETQHGLNKAAQEQWNKKISEELSRL